MRRTHVGAAALLVACSAPSTAGPPYVTDDPEPTDLHRWEVYGFGSGTLFRRGSDGEGGFDINYGGARDLQLSAVLSLDYSHDPGVRTHVGVADTEVGAKYRFLHETKGTWLPDVGLFPKLELPTAGRRFGSGRVGVSVPMWAQKDLGKWSLFGGGGWTLNPGAGNRNYGFGGLALTRSVTNRLSLGGEVYHQTADAIDTRTSTGLGVGASWSLTKKWSLIGSAGPLIQNRSAAGRYAAYLALEFHN